MMAELAQGNQAYSKVTPKTTWHTTGPLALCLLCKFSFLHALAVANQAQLAGVQLRAIPLFPDLHAQHPSQCA